MFGVCIIVLFAVLAITSVIVLCIRAVINIHFAKLDKEYIRLSKQVAKAEQELKVCTCCNGKKTVTDVDGTVRGCHWCLSSGRE